jgi:phosphatidylglycerophosphate synthase
VTVQATGAAGSRWLTLANGLTALRLAVAPALVVALLRGASGPAAALFALAVATDLLDGRVARRFGEVSPLGGLLDHAADATLVVAGLGALALRGAVPAALPVLVAAAFFQYVLDSSALAGRRLRASGLGRLNGIAYFVLLGIPVVRDALGLRVPGAAPLRLLAFALVATTLLSMGDRAAAWLRLRASGRGA